MKNNYEIIDRIQQLRNAIAYSRSEKKIMSIEQGIMCNQEIASWFGVLDFRTKYPRYTIPPHIDDKVQQIAIKIIDTNWIKPQIEIL
jgi:hypothetical protein